MQIHFESRDPSGSPMRAFATRLAARALFRTWRKVKDRDRVPPRRGLTLPLA
jgi:hypothetical protein